MSKHWRLDYNKRSSHQPVKYDTPKEYTKNRILKIRSHKMGKKKRKGESDATLSISSVK